MKTNLRIKLFLSGFIIILFMSNIFAQYDFVDVTGLPVLSYGEYGQFDDKVVWNPTVIRVEDTLKMWYTGGDVIIWDGPACKIGYAWSLDGISWNRHPGNPVLSPSLEWEGESYFGCAVRKDGALYKMWYGADCDPGYPGKIIGYATSVDGITWNKHADPVLHPGPSTDWDRGHISPTSITKKDGLYHLWFWGALPNFPANDSYPQTGLATSPDGINWTKYNDPSTTSAPFVSSDPILKTGSYPWDWLRAMHPTVLRKGSGYEMCYVGLGNDDSGIGYATSEDGIEWEKHPELALSGPTAWGNTIYGGTVLKYDDIYHLWFSCFHSNLTMASPQTGYATSIIAGIDLNPINQNFRIYPNPFNTSVTIEYELHETDMVSITFFNSLGEKILVKEEKQTIGKQQFLWKAEGFPSGIYFCVLKTNAYHLTRKITKLD